MSHFRESLVQLPMDRRGVFMGIAVSLTVLVDALITTAFWTASWMVFDDTAAMVPKPVMPFRLPFHKLGLWDLCFRLYQRGNPFNPFSVVCELMVKMPNFQASVPGNNFSSHIFIPCDLKSFLSQQYAWPRSCKSKRYGSQYSWT